MVRHFDKLNDRRLTDRRRKLSNQTRNDALVQKNMEKNMKDKPKIGDRMSELLKQTIRFVTYEIWRITEKEERVISGQKI